MSEDDDLLFADEEPEPELEPARKSGEAWSVLVVDDDREIHTMTQLLLKNIVFKSKGIEIISAYSAKEGEEILRNRSDIAIIFLDVVMESDDAGLVLARKIREEYKNWRTRIILRTGQPGQAPEREVILDYDINDYKAKTELTAQKLFTATIAALRAYEDILALDLSREGLKRIIEASSSLQQARSLKLFASGVLTQLSALLGGNDGILCVQKGEGELKLLAGSGRFEEWGEDQGFDAEIARSLNQALDQKATVYNGKMLSIYIATPNGKEIVVHFNTGRRPNPLDLQLAEVFCGNISVSFDNIYLTDQLKRAHKGTVLALAELSEHRDTDTGAHVIRVADLVSEIASTLHQEGHFVQELDELFREQIGLASMLHDIGKISIPDEILKKPARLTQEERDIMEVHTIAGAAALERTQALAENSRYLEMGREIALYHHERFDGQGYPERRTGHEIPIAARIVAVADVFDALVSKRPYKEPWPFKEAVEYIEKHAGSQFDPLVVKAFLKAVHGN